MRAGDGTASIVFVAIGGTRVWGDYGGSGTRCEAFVIFPVLSRALSKEIKKVLVVSLLIGRSARLKFRTRALGRHREDWGSRLRYDAWILLGKFSGI